MTNSDELRAIAQRITTAQDDAVQIEPSTTRSADFDVDTAYAVAHLIHDSRTAAGAVPVGRKIGFTNASMWPVYDVHEPIWGYVYDSTVVRMQSAAEGATCRIGRYSEPKIEPEIILHFGATPAANADVPGILSCVDWIAHGFEIVQSAYPGWKFKIADTIANSAMHATLLVGPPQPVAQLGPDLIDKLERFSLALLRNGVVEDTGVGANVLGSPLAAVQHLLRVLARQPQYPPLSRGEMVTTGTLTAAMSVHPGENWSTRLEGVALPGISVDFVA
ncbi:MAG: decarboxylase [Betaproteobacteria bacterium]